MPPAAMVRGSSTALAPSSQAKAGLVAAPPGAGAQHAQRSPEDGGVEGECEQQVHHEGGRADTATLSAAKPEATMNQPTTPCSPPSRKKPNSRSHSPRPDRPADAEHDQRHDKDDADQAAPEPVDPFQPEDCLKPARPKPSCIREYCGMC